MRSAPNPYAAPTHDAQAVQAPGPLHLARRRARFAARLIDIGLLGALLLLGFALACGVMFVRWLPLIDAGKSVAEIADRSAIVTVLYACTLPPPLLFYAYQCYLVVRSGQSLGKRWLRVRIVRTNGEHAGFVRGLLVRSWLMNLLGLIPVLGVLLVVADVLMIFWPDSLCVHDVMADTMVIDVRAR